MSEFLLTQVINYGAPILGLILFIGALGVPFPGTFLVIAVGAFCRQGFLAWHVTGVIALLCARICAASIQRVETMGPGREKFSTLGWDVSLPNTLSPHRDFCPGKPYRRHRALSIQAIFNGRPIG